MEMGMTCLEYSDMVLPFLDGKLKAFDTERLMQHLKECADCSKHFPIVMLLRAAYRPNMESFRRSAN